MDTVPYGCWRKHTLEQIGLFDTALIRNQDDELNLRLLRAGGKIWQSRKIVSWYSPRPTIAALFHQYFQYGFWKVAVIRKHKLPGSWRHLIPAVFVASNIGAFAAFAALTMAEAKAPAYLLAGVWLALAGLYAACSAIASVAAAKRHGWEALPYLPLVFSAYHASYGLGFLGGLLFLRRVPKNVSTSLFTRITR